MSFEPPDDRFVAVIRGGFEYEYRGPAAWLRARKKARRWPPSSVVRLKWSATYGDGKSAVHKFRRILHERFANAE